MAWPIKVSACDGSQRQAGDMLLQIQQFCMEGERAQDAGWIAVRQIAATCFNNDSHGAHSTTSDNLKFMHVCRTFRRTVQNNLTPNDSATCLEEINHGGGGSGPGPAPGPTIASDAKDWRRAPTLPKKKLPKKKPKTPRKPKKPKRPPPRPPKRRRAR